MNDLKKAIEDVRYLQPMINSFLTMGEQGSLNTVIESAEKSLKESEDVQCNNCGVSKTQKTTANGLNMVSSRPFKTWL